MVQKAQRLVHLMMFVNDKRTFTLRDVMEELGVSRRTALRDLMELSEMGVPFYSEVGAAGCRWLSNASGEGVTSDQFYGKRGACHFFC